MNSRMLLSNLKSGFLFIYDNFFSFFLFFVVDDKNVRCCSNSHSQENLYERNDKRKTSSGIFCIKYIHINKLQ